MVSFALALALAGALMTGCWGKDDSSSSSSSSSMADGSSAFGGDSSDSGMIPGEGDSSSMMDGSSSMGASGDSSSSTSASASAKPAAAQVDGDWQTRLVNGSHPLPEDFSVETVSVEHYDDRLFDARAVGHLNDMMKGAADAGLPLYLVSTYRSVKRQTALFNRKINYYIDQGYDAETAKQEAAKWVAAPGTSEHNLGLAADLVSAKWYSSHDDLTEDFEQTPEFAWLAAHCAEYGFILRYPKGKTGVTGVSYEPWHYRYVGVEAAKYLTENGLCLEEL